MRRFSLLIYLFGFSMGFFAQTYNGTTGTFSANTTSYFNLTVNGLTNNYLTGTFGLEWVRISLTCENTHNISVLLLAPDNTEVVLTNQITWGTDYSNTYFKDNATYFMNEGYGTYTGYFRPDEYIGVINNGQYGNGLWRLKIVNRNGSSGTLSSWALRFSTTPSAPFTFTTSDLPLILINTNGQIIPDEPKIAAVMRIIDNPSGINSLTDTPTFTSNIGIEIRGQSSQSVVKKSYGITSRDVNGADVDVSIFGMPLEEDWVLIANYNDKSLIRNALAYELTRETGRYASRTQFCEVFINNQYRGVYHFGEKIKRDHNRVDIAKLEPTENSGIDLTGGYILKIDKEDSGGEPGFVSPFSPINHPNNQVIKFLYEYPDADAITNEQKTYIEDYVLNNFETSLNSSQFDDPVLGYRPYADEESFMDYFFITEIGKNVDGYRISTFLHKDKDGELVMGPIWDFDLAFRNANYCEGDLYTGWAFEFPCSYDYWQPPFWWSRLFEDDVYCHDMHQRWVQYRQTIFSDEAISDLIDQMSGEVYLAQARNFQKWNTMGRYIWPNPVPIATTYNEEITNTKTWILNRLHWIDDNLPNPNTVDVKDITENQTIRIFPNPANSGSVNIQWIQTPVESQLSLVNINGKTVFETKLSTDIIQKVNFQNLTSGIYVCKISNQKGMEFHKLIIQ